MEEYEIVEGLDNIVVSIQRYRDSIIQLQRNNKKLNDDITALEKDKELAYVSFNTDTHVLVDKSLLESIVEDLEEAKDSAYSASEEADSAKTSADDAEYSARQAEDLTRGGILRIETILQPKPIEEPSKKMPARKDIDKNNQD